MFFYCFNFDISDGCQNLSGMLSILKLSAGPGGTFQTNTRNVAYIKHDLDKGQCQHNPCVIYIFLLLLLKK